MEYTSWIIMDGLTLFHGMTGEQFDRYYGDNHQIPKLWTTGPINAFGYSFTYSFDNKGGNLIWVINEGIEDNFRKKPGTYDMPLLGMSDTSPPHWYECVQNPFTSQEERDDKVKLYTPRNLEEYLELYLGDKSLKERLLRMVSDT